MAERIEMPQLPQGTGEEQMQALYSYLYRMAEALNSNLAEIGGATLTDGEAAAMRQVLEPAGEDGKADNRQEAETLKSMIIKTAEFIRTAIDQYNMKLVGSMTAEGKLGKYVRNTRLDVDVTPTGIQQNYTFQEIIQGLKTYEINAKNYIKSGFLRTEGGLPVYGVAIGKDVVTFAEDGTETYNDGNKVLELTADVISFWQNGVKIASYTGSRISFWFGNAEMFYIENGKIYCAGNLELAAQKTFTGDLNAAGGTFAGDLSAAGGTFNGDISAATGTFTGGLNISGKTVSIETNNMEIDGSNGAITGKTLNGVGQVSASYGITPTSLAFVNGLHAHSIKTVDSVGQFSDIVMNAGMLGNDYGGYIGLSGLYTELRKAYGQTPDPVLLPYADETCGIGNSSKKFNEGHFVSLKTADLKADVIVIDGYVQSIYPKTHQTGSVGISGHMFSDGWFSDLYYFRLNALSSREVKQNIEDLPENGEAIDQLRPVCYEYKEEPGRRRFGLIHEEAAEVLPEICTGIGEKDPERRGINYVELVPVLLKEIQSLRKRVTELEQRTGGK